VSDARGGKWTILEVLNWTKGHFESKGLDSARQDAEILLAHVLGTKRVMLYARFDQPLVGDELTQMRTLVARRARGEPVAHLVGKKEFWSLELEVTADTLVPRPDTEALVEVALELGRAAKVVVDVGTGTGAIACALAKELPEARVFATDVSEAALAVARRNVERHGLAERVELLQGDLLDALPQGAPPVDLLAANLPYIPSRDIAGLMRDVREFEPRLALDGGPDGLDPIRRLVAAAGAHLASGAHVVLEAGADQVPALAALLSRAGFVDVGTREDAAGLLRVAFGRWP